jgi:hypothetical protein
LSAAGLTCRSSPPIPLAVLYYHEGQWQTWQGSITDSLTPDLETVSMVSPSDVWVFGKDYATWPNVHGIVLHWDGSRWTQVPIRPTPLGVTANLAGGVPISGSMWAFASVGDPSNAADQTKVAELLHCTTTCQGTGTSVAYLISIQQLEMVSPTQGFAVAQMLTQGDEGQEQRGLVLFYNGGSWTLLPNQERPWVTPVKSQTPVGN